MQKPPIVIDGPFKERDKYPLYHSLRGDPRVLGLEGQLNPVIHFNSTPRSNMASSQIVQATIVDGAEMPQMTSGFEQKFIEYTFNTSRMPQAGTSRYVIPKYRANTGSNPIRSTPSYTLIYIGQEDQQLHYVNVPTYVKGQDGFGYLTEINFKKLMSNVGLEKGECIAHSHAVQGEQYCLGTNLSTCYLTAKETVEDAVWLSESGARKLGTTGIKKVTINWGCNDVALNLYGDELTYKFMPDIGDRIRDDGIIAALRKVDDNSIIADMNDTALTTVQDIHDTVYYGVTSEATVIDIDVWINESKKVKTPEHIFAQLNKYVEENKYYYKRILEIFQLECVQNRIQPSVEFGTLVERAASFMSIYTRNSPVLGMTKRSVPKLSRKSEPIPFIQIDIHYAFKYVVNVGYKITNRDASKGVISRI